MTNHAFFVENTLHSTLVMARGLEHDVCYGIALTASQFAENEDRIGYFRTALFYTDTILVGAGLTVGEPGWA